MAFISQNNIQFLNLKDCEKSASKRQRNFLIEIPYEESRQISVIGLIQVYALNGALGKHEKRSFIKVAISLMKLDLPWSSAMYERKRKYKKSFIRFVLLKMNFHSRVVPSKVARLLN